MSSNDEEDENAFDELGLGIKVTLIAFGFLFVLFVILILLHFYAKYLKRLQERSRGRASLHRLQTQIGDIAPIDITLVQQPPQPKRGLEPLVIASLPEFIYRSMEHKDKGHEVVECSVCLTNINDETTVRLLPNCKHMFHLECIDMWLGSNSTCPICRAVVEPIRAQEEPEKSTELDHHSSVGGGGGRVQPTAPAIDENMVQVRLSSFRRMLSRERSSRRVDTCDEESGRDDF
ncbi:RING-H2 finger protein ATL39 [Ziziphus jujuba]|uniref:RING-type E3 ubiquitin transferase n=1 Tax=Ziziphus jujuba TaxID=326968 RepID=A0A6P3Z696_ZIZJJ|nr:RING-H2 finger protein ATL39 [Ziziphus jujuba]